MEHPSRSRWWRAVAALGALGLAACSAGSSEGAPSTETTTTAAGLPSAGRAAGIEVAWATTMNGPTVEDEIDGVAADDDGALWVTGKFERSTTLGGTELTSAGAADIPLARFDADGTPLWVRSFGGTGEDNVFDIDASADGAVASGWFEGTIVLDDVELTSKGSVDCLVVAFDPSGSVRWARSFGGPGPDGCNEVVVADDGSVATSIDTAGGWRSPAGLVPTDRGRDVVLLRLEADGRDRWAGLVSGPRTQRGKSLAVSADGTVALGGDTTGDVVVGGKTAALPGARTDAWVSIWSADGEPRSVTAWGGPGADIAKGVAFGRPGEGVWAVGQFEGRFEVGVDTVDAGSAADLAVVRVGLDGTQELVGTVQADRPLAGAEVVAATDGGVLFGTPVQPGTTLVPMRGGAAEVVGEGAAALVWWSPDGSAQAWAVEGTVTPGSDEIAREGDRVYLELVLRGAGNTAAGTPLAADRKDGSVWALDLTD